MTYKMKTRIGAMLIVGFLCSGCISLLTPKHKELIDNTYENAVAYVSRFDDAENVTADPAAPIPADVLQFLRQDVRSWAAMYAIAHGKNIDDILPPEGD